MTEPIAPEFSSSAAPEDRLLVALMRTAVVGELAQLRLTAEGSGQLLCVQGGKPLGVLADLEPKLVWELVERMVAHQGHPDPEELFASEGTLPIEGFRVGTDGPRFNGHLEWTSSGQLKCEFTAMDVPPPSDEQDDALAVLRSERSDLPAVRLDELQPPADLGSLLPPYWRRSAAVVPVAATAEALIVATADPWAPVLKVAHAACGLRIEPVIAAERHIVAQLDAWRPTLIDVFLDVADKGKCEGSTAARALKGLLLQCLEQDFAEVVLHGLPHQTHISVLLGEHWAEFGELSAGLQPVFGRSLEVHALRPPVKDASGADTWTANLDLGELGARRFPVVARPTRLGREFQITLPSG